MNAQTIPTSSLTTVAITNEAALRVLAKGPLVGAAAVAHASGLAQKNMARQLDLLKRDGLVREEAAHDERGRDAVSFNLTDAGRLALQAMDLAAGRLDLGGAGAGDPGNDVLLLQHHQLRRNPLNARRLDLDNPAHRQGIDELKSQIVAAGDVLQNLVVFPADAEGIHDLFAGERRWTAVGELIEEGQWARERPLRAIQRDNTPGQTAFISLVENSQVPLTVMERARAYRTLCADTGWSAREAALRTGWDVKSVQQYLQVLRDADPDHIAAHDAGDADWNWEALRKSVQTSREVEVQEPAQADLVEAAGERPFDLDEHATRNLGYHAKNCAALKPRQRLMLVELADKVLRDPAPGRERQTFVASDHVGTTSDFILAGAGFQSGGGGPCLASIAASTLEWLRLEGLLTATGDRDAVLQRAREEAGVGALAIANAVSLDRYVTPWLDPEWKPEAPAPAEAPDTLTPSQRRVLREIAARSIHRHRLMDDWVQAHAPALADPDFQALYDLAFIVRKGGDRGEDFEVALTLAGRDHLKAQGQAPQEGLSRNSCATPWLREAPPSSASSHAPPIHFGGGATQATPPGPPKAAAAPDAILKPVQRLAMVELAHKLLTAPDGKDSDGQPTVYAPRYWLDQTAADLKGMGLVVFMHLTSGPPIAFLVKAGRAWVAANFAEIGEATLATERDSQADLEIGADGYVTPWLNASRASEPSPQLPRVPEQDGGEQSVDADRQRRADADENMDEDLLDLLIERVRSVLESTRGEDTHWSNIASLTLAETALAAAANGQITEAVVALGALLRKEQHRQIDADAMLQLAASRKSHSPGALLVLKEGDMVSVGGSASGYRLLSRDQHDGAHSQGFVAQAVRLNTGKDHGAPRHITLHAIQSVLPTKEG